MLSMNFSTFPCVSFCFKSLIKCTEWLYFENWNKSDTTIKNSCIYFHFIGWNFPS